MYKVVLKLNKKGCKICGSKKYSLYMDYENNDTPDITYVNDFIKREFSEDLVDNIECVSPSIIHKLVVRDVVKIWDSKKNSHIYGYITFIDEKYIYVLDVDSHWNTERKFNAFGEECGNKKNKLYITIPNEEECKYLKNTHFKDFLYQKIYDIFIDIDAKNNYFSKCPDIIAIEDLEALYNILKKYDRQR